MLVQYGSIDPIEDENFDSSVYHKNTPVVWLVEWLYESNQDIRMIPFDNVSLYMHSFEERIVLYWIPIEYYLDRILHRPVV